MSDESGCYCETPHGRRELGHRIDLRFAKIDPRAVTPSWGTVGAAGLDLYATIDEDVVIYPLEQAMIPTMIAIELPRGYVGIVCGRSGLTRRLAHVEPGIIDSDYRGGIGVVVQNRSGVGKQVIAHGDRIAQLVIVPVAESYLVEVPADQLSQTQRGALGWGSTGR